MLELVQAGKNGSSDGSDGVICFTAERRGNGHDAEAPWLVLKLQNIILNQCVVVKEERRIPER